MSLKAVIAVFGTAMISSFILTWIVRAVMRRAGILDVPKSRKAHREPVAYEGGLALFGGLLCAIAPIPLLAPEFGFDLPGIQGLRELTGILIGVTIVTAIGAADDLLDLKPWFKFGVQLGVGALMYRYGFRLEKISNPFGAELIFPPAASMAFTALWFALLMNGINMIDGLDGLAAGIVAITGIALAAISVDLEQPLSVLLSVALVGICLGFLPFNFTPASIFMGDAGSLLLGFLLAAITLLSSTKAPAFLALLIPVLAVGVPVFETLFSFIRRIARGKHPFSADRRHLHHRFIMLGFSERRTVLMFYYITAYFGVSAYVLQRLDARATLAMVVIIAAGMLLLVENMRFLQRSRETE